MSKLLFIISIFFICGIANNVLAAIALPIKTGQTTVYRTGDDGTYQTGMKWDGVGPRFITILGYGTEASIKDRLTGLIWSGNANIDGQKTWAEATNYCENLFYAGFSDWKLPNVLELKSLIDFSEFLPALPSGHPFSAVQENYHWTSSPYLTRSDFAWFVDFRNGNVDGRGLNGNYYVWPVRAGR